MVLFNEITLVDCVEMFYNKMLSIMTKHKFGIKKLQE